MMVGIPRLRRSGKRSWMLHRRRFKCAFCGLGIPYEDLTAAVAPAGPPAARGSGYFHVVEVHKACHQAWLCVHRWTEEKR